MVLIDNIHKYYKQGILIVIMTIKKVIAYFMHEHEADAARQMMPGAEETPSFMLGEVEEAKISEMRN
jgi:hypothetical protein